MKKEHTTVLIIIDGGRADYVERHKMPFLYGLQNAHLSASLRSPPGADPHTALFLGKCPDRADTFAPYVFDPENSPYKWSDEPGPLRLLTRPRRPSGLARRTIGEITRMKTARGVAADPAYIPFPHLRYFRPNGNGQEAPEASQTLFDLCAENGRTHHMVVGDDDATVEDDLVRALRGGAPHDLFVAEFKELDRAGHRHGPLGDAQREVLKSVDERLARVHAALAAAYRSWDLLICGDHGMSPVHHRVDILEVLRTMDAEPGKDYVVFIDSTLVSLWHLTDKGRTAIDAISHRIPGGEVLDDQARRRLRLPTGRRWGDRVIAARPGVLFWPDFVHPPDQRIEGVHGHLDKREEANGMAVLASSETRSERRTAGERPLVDVFPTLCDLLAVPTPRGQEGTSLLHKERRPLLIGG